MKKRRLRRKIKVQIEEDSSYFDLGSLSKGLFLFGIILILTYSLFILTMNSSTDSIWDDAYVGRLGAFFFIVPLSFILILASVILFFFHRQFVELSEFAEEVESGEFERKILLELEGEEVEKNRSQS